MKSIELKRNTYNVVIVGGAMLEAAVACNWLIARILAARFWWQSVTVGLNLRQARILTAECASIYM